MPKLQINGLTLKVSELFDLSKHQAAFQLKILWFQDLISKKWQLKLHEEKAAETKLKQRNIFFKDLQSEETKSCRDNEK